MNAGNNKGVIELVFKIFDILTTAKDGKSRVFNIIVMLVIFFVGFTVYQWEDLKSIYKETRFETYQETLDFDRNNSFLSTAQQQLQILYTNSKADLTVVYEYYPPNKHFFYSALFYEGMLPDGLGDIDKFQSVPIDKTTVEYRKHMGGLHYTSTEEFTFFPSEFNDKFSYIFSCPIFNLDNVYSGNISMIWYETPNLNKEDLDDLNSLCFQSSRVLGRSK